MLRFQIAWMGKVAVWPIQDVVFSRVQIGVSVSPFEQLFAEYNSAYTSVQPLPRKSELPCVRTWVDLDDVFGGGSWERES